MGQSGAMTMAAELLRALSAAEAVSGIRSGDRVFIGGIACPPESLVEAIAARAHELGDVWIWHLPLLGKVPFIAPEFSRSFRVTTSFIGPDLREPVAEGRADFVPAFLSETPKLFGARYPIDWAVVQLSPPDRQGFCSAGVSVDNSDRSDPAGRRRFDRLASIFRHWRTGGFYSRRRTKPRRTPNHCHP